MQKLTRDRFDKAVAFIKTEAQDIDKAMYEYFFENKPIADVVDILATYQNEDGGFGTLDYDMECSCSCLKHTESACRYIFDLNDIPDEHPMIQRLIAYILRNYNDISGEWDNLTVPAVNDHPHAPWWGHNEAAKFIPQNRTDLIEHYDPNTNSALAAMLVKYDSLVPKETLDTVMGIVMEKINTTNEYGQYGMNSDVYFVDSLHDKNLKSSLLMKLMGNGKLISILDQNWGTENAYKLCHWIDSPDHPFYFMYKDAVHNNFHFLIQAQEEDGSWSPNWSWGASDVWERVVKRIKGELTYKFLLAFKRFDYIDE